MDPPHASVAAAVVISSAASVQNVIAPAAPPAAATAAPGAAVPTTQAATQSAHGIISRPTTSAAPSRVSIVTHARWHTEFLIYSILNQACVGIIIKALHLIFKGFFNY